MFRFGIIIFLTFGMGIIQTQAQLIQAHVGETVPPFEVATIKLDVSRGPRKRLWSDGDEFHIQNLSLREIIKASYGAHSDEQVSGGPGELLSERFDITAKVDQSTVSFLRESSEAAADRRFYLMLQSLLAERFQLKVHFAPRLMPVMALVPAKSGAKLTLSVAPQPVRSNADDGVPADQEGRQVSPSGDDFSIKIHTKQAQIVAKDATLDTFAIVLSDLPEMGGLPVVNQTALDGRYDWELRWTPNNLKNIDNPDLESTSEWPFLATALNEQLGLKLVKKKDTVLEVVIDHVQPPSAN